MGFDKKNLYWYKNTGKRILIKDMSNTYLLETICRIEQAAKNDKGKILKSKLHKKYNILRLHALSRDLKIKNK